MKDDAKVMKKTNPPNKGNKSNVGGMFFIT
jgi:hypothetical protein